MVENVAGLALQAGATVDGSPILTEDSTLEPTKRNAQTVCLNIHKQTSMFINKCTHIHLHINMHKLT